MRTAARALSTLEGYRDGTGRRRVELLVDAIGRFFAMANKQISQCAAKSDF